MFTKSQSLPLLLLPFLAIARPGSAQAQQGGAPIHVTSTIHNDGTRTEMKTDPDNHTAESTTYDAANKMRQRTVYSLDENGQAVGGTVYSPKNLPLYKLVYKRDGMNRVNEVDAYSMKDVLLTRMIYHYDAKGKVISVDTLDANGRTVTNGINGTQPGSLPGKKRAPSPAH